MLAIGLVIFVLCSFSILVAKDFDPPDSVKAVLILGWLGGAGLMLFSVAIFLWDVMP